MVRGKTMKKKVEVKKTVSKKKSVVKVKEKKTLKLATKTQIKPIKPKTPKKAKVVHPTDTEILQNLRTWIPKLVRDTVSRYQSNSLSSIFNEADMTALAEDTSLEILRRVKIGLNDPNHNDSVDLKGAVNYFKRSFINQTLKLYEKFAKTDIRAGIQTVSSDEALAVAASKNLYSPEDTYIVEDHMKKIFALLNKVDKEFNHSLIEYYKKLGKEVQISDLQHYEDIVRGVFDGNTAQDICTSIQISNADFLRQKRMAFEFIKTEMPTALEDMMEHFEVEEDYRIHTKDVNKRQKFKQEVRNYRPKILYYIGSKIDKDEDKFVATLYARIDMYDQYENKSNKVVSKLVEVESLRSNPNEDEMKKVKDLLWKNSKNPETHQRMDQVAKSYLEEIKNKAVS